VSAVSVFLIGLWRARCAVRARRCTVPLAALPLRGRSGCEAYRYVHYVRAYRYVVRPLIA
jgi:hypothetical protein